ncbi:hypothetical protein [Sphingomonas cavernae]|uniref:Uncharacterized protein n=1 Tax=Sphingomonas cavernae TaxID=2320861 RepID=A0A418WKJ8_9SPHN|nr:hypothetical protein [Sphingomonas cavernae]RJF90359.1 hypothetical protein D3876_08870 [Sphingomonas cavernae]
MSVTPLHYAVFLLMLGQGLWLTIAPQRFAAHQLWIYRRLFVARPAEPGRQTFLYYRLTGIAALAISLFIFFQITANS